MQENLTKCLACGYPPEKITKYCPKCNTLWGREPGRPVAQWIDPDSLPLPPIVVREYASQEAFQNDAVKLKARGYDVLSVNERSQNAGCLRILTLGLLALVVRPKPHIIVTYQQH
jgi:hypothetical protein